MTDHTTLVTSTPHETRAAQHKPAMPTPRTRRRDMLRATLGAAAATLGAAVLLEEQTGRAAAASGSFDSSTPSTPALTVTTTNGATGITIKASPSGYGLIVASGVAGISTTGSVYGLYSDGGSFAAIRGNSTAIGIYGQGMTGVQGNGNSPGALGVYGHALFEGAGVKAESASGPQLYLVPGTTVGHPSSGSHHMGEVFVDARGTLFFCVASGTPGTWKQITLM